MTLLGMSNGSTHFENNTSKESGETDQLEVDVDDLTPHNSRTISRENVEGNNLSASAHLSKTEDTDGRRHWSLLMHLFQKHKENLVLPQCLKVNSKVVR